MNNESQSFEFLDAVTIAAFIAQLSNIEDNKKYNNWIKEYLKRQNELLYRVIEQNDEILKILKKK